jgi:prepilin-type N-terminal cleavage/methylation domain-containing protein
LSLKPVLVSEFPDKSGGAFMKTNHSSTTGFTLVEIMIVVAIIGLLAAIAIPNFTKSRTRAQAQVCTENLSKIESAKQIWAVENNKVDGDVPTTGDLVGPLLFLKQMPACPGGGTYQFNSVGTTATCSISGHTL